MKSKLIISLLQELKFYFRLNCVKNRDFIKQSHLFVDLIAKPYLNYVTHVCTS